MNDMSPTLGRRGLFKLSGGLVVAFSLFNPADVLAANGAAGCFWTDPRRRAA